MAGINENTAAGASVTETGAEQTAIQAPGPDKIHIADEVIVAIVALAIGKVPAAALSVAGGGEGIAGLLGKRNTTKGIRIETGDGVVGAEVSITVDYGKKIAEVAEELQNTVRADVEHMTGLTVSHVNVHVLGINHRDAPATATAPVATGAPATASAPDAASSAPAATGE